MVVKEEFEILKKNVAKPIIAPFQKEIEALVDKFMNSGQSGGSAPYVAGAISEAVKNLCLQKPLYGLTLEDWEWGTDCGVTQNRRLSSVFKDDAGKAYFLDAIVFKPQSGICFTSGSVELKSGGSVGSRQYIKSTPFKPKTFYIDVIETEWYKDPETGELTKEQGGGWWTSIVKDESQLDEVWEYYDRYCSVNKA